METSDSSWVPALLLASLGCFFLQKAIRPRAKQSWSWGRGGGCVPVSRWGYASWAGALLVVAVISRTPEPPAVSVAGLFACFLAILAAGFADTRRHRHEGRSPDPWRERDS